MHVYDLLEEGCKTEIMGTQASHVVSRRVAVVVAPLSLSLLSHAPSGGRVFVGEESRAGGNTQCVP